MSKYNPLLKTLERESKEAIHLTFAEIERILGFNLPKSARKLRPWWSNDPTTHTQARAWLTAGYRATEVNLENEQVIFLKQRQNAEDPATDHPVFGCMAGTVTLMDGVDLTEPALPEWGDMTLNGV